jgi:hypothetical protein
MAPAAQHEHMDKVEGKRHPYKLPARLFVAGLPNSSFAELTVVRRRLGALPAEGHKRRIDRIILPNNFFNGERLG